MSLLRLLAPVLAYLYVSFVGLTSRLRWLGLGHLAAARRSRGPVIYAFWHQRQVFFTWTHRGSRLKVLVSRSQDGEIIARAMALSRIGAVRGSSSRGGAAAARELLDALAAGCDVAVTCDGPKGPAREVKPGILYLAQKTGLPIVPIANAVSHRLEFSRSWDRFQVPLPFSRAEVRHGPPVFVGPQDDLAAKARELKAALDRAHEEADRSTASSLLTLPVLALLNLLAPLAALGLVAKFLASSRRGLLRGLPSELDERLGGLPAGAEERLAGRRVLWVHAASAGEVAAVDELLRRVHARPAAPAILMTTTTSAGRDAARRLAHVDAAALAPMDCWPAVRRFLRRARPYALVLVETELWPNMLELSARAGLRIGLVNARLSERSFSRYRLAAGLLRPFLGRLDKVAARTESDGRRFLDLGLPPDRLLVAGNMKYDRLAPARDDTAVRDRLVRLGWQGCAILAAGSTHPGEHEQVLAAFRQARGRFPELRLILAPRHLEKAAEVEAALLASGVAFSRWSKPQDDPRSECLLLDAMGVLRACYSQAAVAFVGGTLVPVGGHNLLEPALAGVPVLFGPHTAHTRETAEGLLACGGGFSAADASGLAEALSRLLADPALAAQSGRQALSLARSLQGATARTLEHLAAVLEPPASP